MLVVLGMVVQGHVVVEDAVAVHGLVQAVPGTFQGGTELAVALRVRARGDGVDVGHGALDLVQDQPGVVGRERARAVHPHLHGAGVGGDVGGTAAVAAAHPQRDPGGAVSTRTVALPDAA